MPSTQVTSVGSPIHIEYEVMGESHHPPVLLVMGFTAQMIAWPDRFCEMLVSQGLQVIRFDNRDCGLSEKMHGAHVDPGVVMAARLTDSEIPPVPYTLTHMAADAIGLLDTLNIDQAHVVGASMGGMIVQTMAIEHPQRVRSMTSIMSMTGEMEFGSPTPEAAEVLLAPPPSGRDEYVANSVNARVWQSRRYFNEERVKTEAARAYDRSFYPEGASRQLAAIYASGSRAEGLQQLRTPTLVIHGTDDTLLQPDGGQRTADLVANSSLLMVADMGHDLPDPLLPLITGAIGSHIELAERNRH